MNTVSIVPKWCCNPISAFSLQQTFVLKLTTRCSLLDGQHRRHYYFQQNAKNVSRYKRKLKLHSLLVETRVTKRRKFSLFESDVVRSNLVK